jgi:hypothetical protein
VEEAGSYYYSDTDIEVEDDIKISSTNKRILIANQ